MSLLIQKVLTSVVTLSICMEKPVRIFVQMEQYIFSADKMEQEECVSNPAIFMEKLVRMTGFSKQKESALGNVLILVWLPLLYKATQTLASAQAYELLGVSVWPNMFDALTMHL